MGHHGTPPGSCFKGDRAGENSRSFAVRLPSRSGLGDLQRLTGILHETWGELWTAGSCPCPKPVPSHSQATSAPAPPLVHHRHLFNFAKVRWISFPPSLEPESTIPRLSERDLLRLPTVMFIKRTPTRALWFCSNSWSKTKTATSQKKRIKT